MWLWWASRPHTATATAPQLYLDYISQETTRDGLAIKEKTYNKKADHCDTYWRDATFQTVSPLAPAATMSAGSGMDQSAPSKGPEHLKYNVEQPLLTEYTRRTPFFSATIKRSGSSGWKRATIPVTQKDIIMIKTINSFKVSYTMKLY